MTLYGVFTALVTPFDENNKLDEEGLRQNIQYQIENGIDGIMPLGTTGEAPTLSHAEKKRVVRISVEEAKGKVPIIVGTGSYSTQQTIENTKEAEQLGGEIALVVTPYYNKPTQEGIYLHFKTLADAVSIPIIVYNIQGRTGQNIQTETLQRLAEHPRIIGVKEASGSITQISDVIEKVAKVRPDFSILSGDDAITLSLMALGGHGIISVCSNLVPRQIADLVQALKNQNYDLARELHYRLMPLFRAAFVETNPMPIKTAMRYCGMPAGRMRLPMCDLVPENEKKLIAVLEQYPELCTFSSI